MKIRTLLIWFLAGVLLIAGSMYWGSRNIIVCWDGIEVNEPLLIEQCGITQQEYFSGEFLGSDSCAEESGAIQYVGSCDPDWTLITVQTAGIGLAYLVLSALLFGAWKLLGRK